MEVEGWLLYIEQCLKKFEYPNIYGINMSEIFGVSNRMFLLSWLYRQIYGLNMNEILPEDILSEFLKWYCKSSQVKGILKADMKYPVQLNILYRIFKSLDSMENKGSQNSYNNVMPYDINILCQREINIFKKFGSIKTCDDRDFNIVEMANSKHAADENNVSKDEDVEFPSPSLESVKLFEMERKVKSATAIVSSILRNFDSDSFDVELDKSDIKLLRILNEDTEKGKKYIKNVEALSRVPERLNDFNLDIPDGNNDESIGMAKEVVRLIHIINDM